MKRICIAIQLVILSNCLCAQTYEDNQITVTVSDTSKLYERVRQAIIFSNFMIHESSTRDTLITYPEKMYSKSVFVMAKVIIVGNQVKISGAFGLGLENVWGKASWPKAYQEIVYYKGSDTWPELRHIAFKLDGKISYSKIEYP